ncbi:MAG: PAS domain-containing sensor histidine kinase [Rhodospirillales bacterium]|nr:PAS domain-containing sensor histidine kinase [Rhodospirillales bacterium]
MKKITEPDPPQTREQLEQLVNTRTRELRDSEEQFRHAARSANLCHWKMDADFLNWTYTSDNTEQMLGVPPEGLFGTLEKYGIYIHPDDRDHVSVQNETSRLTKAAYEISYRWNHPDGSIRYYWEMGEPVFDARSELVEWRGTTQDVTPLKAAEKTALMARAEAEVANRAKSEMLATMSHELRTPLNAIIGFSQMFLGQTFGPIGNPKYHEYASDIFNSSTHLLELIEDILDVSAIESGKVETHFIDVDLCRQAKNMIRLVQPRANDGKLTISNTIPPDSPMLHADERRINQILLNLLSNAVKFTKPGGRIEISVQGNENGDMVLSVLDDGIGMSEAELKHALTPFGQVNRGAASGIHEGTGLGLPLTLSLVTLHGGTMDIESTPGQGTRVAIRFPKERVLPR